MKSAHPIIAALGLFLFVQAAQAQWTPAKRLTWTSGASKAPSIAVDSDGNIHIVWEDETPGNYEIFYKRSTDGGNSWTANQRLTWNSGTSSSPAIAADASGDLHVVWHDITPGNYELFYTKSTDGGASWTAARRITWTPGPSFLPALAADSAGNLYLVWEDNTPGDYEVYFKKSTDGGASWTASQKLTSTPGASYVPTITAVSTGKIQAAWGDEFPGNFEVYHRKSTDGGANWTSKKRLTYTSTPSVRPVIDAVPPGHIFVVWEDNLSGNGELYFKKSSDGGSTWTYSKRLTWTAGGSYFAAMAVDSSGHPHVVWQDATLGNDEIFYKMSPDGGTTWTLQKRLTWNSGSSRNSALNLDSNGNLHVVWEDDSPGNGEIYYKKFVKQ